MKNTHPYSILWAILSVDEKGNEGICVLNTPIGPKVAVTGEKRLLEHYVHMIKNADRNEVPQNFKIVVAEYHRATTTEVIR